MKILFIFIFYSDDGVHFSRKNVLRHNEIDSCLVFLKLEIKIENSTFMTKSDGFDFSLLPLLPVSWYGVCACDITI